MAARTNACLIRAKAPKNDEFYTRREDIEKLMDVYAERGAFHGKRVFLPCDFGEFSEFWNYFSDNFDRLGLARLECTGRNPHDPFDGVHAVKTRDGIQTEHGWKFSDFRFPAPTGMARDADIVITNPPFSLMRDFVDWCERNAKDYVFIGHLRALAYKCVIPLIVSGRVQVVSSRDFKVRNFDGGAVPCNWFTTLEYPCARRRVECIRSIKDGYQKYDNFDAIEVSRTRDIPKDYDGPMGVPVSFMDYYDPAQFDILGTPQDLKVVGGGDVFSRLIIQHVREQKNGK